MRLCIPSLGRAPLARIGLAGLALLAPCAALSAQELIDAREPLATAPLRPPTAWIELGPPSHAGAEELGLLASSERLELGAAPPPAPSTVNRAALEEPRGSAAAPTFDELPGGIVFGLAARPDPALAGARLELQGDRLALRSGERLFLLPPASPALLRASLAFAASSRPGDVVVDLPRGGAVLLAPELEDTEAGAVLLRCDRAPHARAAGFAGTKSVIVDRDVRLSADPATGLARIAADLEVRFYRVERRWVGPEQAELAGQRAIPAGDARDELARDLAPAAELAGWIGFFRHALATDPEGVYAVAQALSQAPAEVHPTPRTLPPAVSDGFRTPSPVADWMRAYRARAESR
jgi:hypothetical protein